MADLDLQEATRRDDTFNQMLEINKLLGEVLVFPSLMWTWAFDVIKDIYDNHQDVDNEYIVVVGTTLKQDNPGLDDRERIPGRTR